MRAPIDVIIPIYNAYEDLKKCIGSIEQYMDLSLDRLILIDDCSPDERIWEYLQSLERDNIVCIHNETNRGFSNNINTGMLYSQDRDVILLNSDTVVTADWIQKLYQCAYSNPEIGTVTPMSNSATLCSYPITCQDNQVPEHLTIDELGHIIERCSLKKYPRITVAVGFCMYVKREVIQAVGLFDAETFGRGYGEENDFCNRAEQYGYIHVMCDNTFIYHKGTVSFIGEEKRKLIEAHDRILNERYPAQMQRNHEYCMEKPDQYIRDNIDIYAKADPNRKNLMYVTHADFRGDAYDNMGGTQFHVRDLVNQLKTEYNVYVAARDREYLRVTLYRDEEEVALKYYIGKADLFPRVRDSQLYALFENLLKAFQIDVLHVHHTHSLSFDMVYAAKKLKIPVILTMHDYYYICPNVKLVNAEEKYCDGCKNMAGCAECLKKKSDIEIGDAFLNRWRTECRKMFELCSQIVIPSEAAKSVVVSYYPDIAEQIRVVEHGLELQDTTVDIQNVRTEIIDEMTVNWDIVYNSSENPYLVQGWAYIRGVCSDNVVPYMEVKYKDIRRCYECTKIMRQDVAYNLKDERYIFSGFTCSIFDKEMLETEVELTLYLKYDTCYYTDGKSIRATLQSLEELSGYNVAFLGGMVPEKGSKLATDMITAGEEKINWHIFGTIADKALLDVQQEHVIKHGTYRQQDLPQLLSLYHIDVVCILPIWPETFCYTLSEAITCGIPVFVTDIGAVGQRVHRHGYGWTVPVDMSGAEMTKNLIQILENEQEYAEKKQIAVDFKEISLQQMAEDYHTMYQEKECSDTVKTDDFDRQAIYEGLTQENLRYDGYYEVVQEKKSIVKQLQDVQLALANTQAALNENQAALTRIRSNIFYRTAGKIKHIFVK